jgi:hypothetical protein
MRACGHGISIIQLTPLSTVAIAERESQYAASKRTGTFRSISSDVARDADKQEQRTAHVASVRCARSVSVRW